MLKSLAIAALALFGFAGAGHAQDFGQRGGTPGDFDFYVLALSWSPGFCELDGDRSRNREQCGEGAGLRFVVHGLWPQNERGYPTECGAERGLIHLAGPASLVLDYEGSTARNRPAKAAEQ